MPDQPGAGSNANEPNGGGGAGAGAGASGGGAPGGQAQEPSAEDKRLSRENAQWRTKFRESETQITTLKQEIEELKKAPQGDPSDIATLKRQLTDLQKSVQQERELRTKAEDARRQEKLDNALLKAVSEAKLLNADEAMIVARTKGRAKVADDGKAVFVITENGEEREVEITAESIKQHKLVSDRFFPADGVPGAGSKGGGRQGAPNGLDYERGLNDPAYFQANEKAMKEETRRRLAGG